MQEKIDHLSIPFTQIAVPLSAVMVRRCSMFAVAAMHVRRQLILEPCHDGARHPHPHPQPALATGPGTSVCAVVACGARRLCGRRGPTRPLQHVQRR